MRVLTFQPRFQAAVASGEKKQTIRASARCKPGDELSLRKWKGKPYRSLQLPLREAVRCTAVKSVQIGLSHDGSRIHITLDDLPLPRHVVDTFALADGFRDADDMRAWFEATHDLPFIGEMIQWE